jgi:hypothetical protein
MRGAFYRPALLTGFVLEVYVDWMKALFELLLPHFFGAMRASSCRKLEGAGAKKGRLAERIFFR